ncbi:12392_t:CDS:2 [Racocetra fulgida]|uniref:12392_t:CDS:1 n=1 Tax=Racocetra fulgida TaxID=60492 RepID=A0A9N9ABC3_9GLOM|nr:12392_t:CDS:2 [Racocetra fulgida]
MIPIVSLGKLDNNCSNFCTDVPIMSGPLPPGEYLESEFILSLS